MSNAERAAGGGRIKSVQDWLGRRADTSLGRLALQWFRGYFDASRNSGCAVTIYSSLSVLPAVLVAIAYFHPSQSDANVFAERLITHLKLDGATASLVHDTFGSASANALAASIAVLISFLLWGIGIGQIYQDVYARAWGIKVGSAADQALFAIFFFVLSGAIALAVYSAAGLRDRGWLVLVPVWLIGSTVFWLWVPRFLLHRKIAPPRATTRRAPGLHRPWRHNRHLAAVPGRTDERERQDVRLVRRRAHDHRLRVRHDDDVAGLRRVLPRLGRVAANRVEASPLGLRQSDACAADADRTLAMRMS